MRANELPHRVKFGGIEFCKDSSGTHTVYTMTVDCGDATWVVKRRYSQFEGFNKIVSKYVTIGAKFPGQGSYFSLSSGQKQRDERREQFQAYMTELLAMSPGQMGANVRQCLCDFLDVEEHREVVFEVTGLIGGEELVKDAALGFPAHSELTDSTVYEKLGRGVYSVGSGMLRGVTEMLEQPLRAAVTDGLVSGLTKGLTKGMQSLATHTSAGFQRGVEEVSGHGGGKAGAGGAGYARSADAMTLASGFLALTSYRLLWVEPMDGADSVTDSAEPAAASDCDSSARASADAAAAAEAARQPAQERARTRRLEMPLASIVDVIIPQVPVTRQHLTRHRPPGNLFPLVPPSPTSPGTSRWPSAAAVRTPARTH